MIGLSGLALLVGHLLGDYVLQNDWLYVNKTNPWPGKEPWSASGVIPGDGRQGLDRLREIGSAYIAWRLRRLAWWRGHLACTLHCLVYTGCIFLALWPIAVLPWWFYLAVGVIHWPIDRFQLAKYWVRGPDGPEAILSKLRRPLIQKTVDQAFHLITLYGLLLLVSN